MHCCGDEQVRAPMIQLPLDPIMLFLLIQPGLGQGRSTKGPAATLQDVNHRQSVVALGALDSQPRSYAAQEGLGRKAGRAPPIPGVTSAALARQSDDPTAPDCLHPVKDLPFSVRDYHTDAVDIALS